MKTKQIFLLGGLLLQLSLLAQIPSYVPTNGLVGWWSFNGNANDLSGNGNNGLVNGAVLTSDRLGNDSSAYLFSNEGYIITNTASNLPLGASERTMSFWMKTNVSDNPNNRDVFGWGYVGPSQAFYFTEMSGKAYLCGAYDDLPGTDSICDDVWHHVAVTYSGSLATIYIDDVLDTNEAKTFNTVLSEIIFGRSPTSHPSPTYYDGLLDDAGIWNRVLTQAEIHALFTAIDQTGIHKDKQLNTISIYPNPTTQFLTVDLQEAGMISGGTIVVENMLGQQMYKQAITSNEIKLNTRSWGEKGIYLIHAYNQNNVYLGSAKILCE